MSQFNPEEKDTDENRENDVKEQDAEKEDSHFESTYTLKANEKYEANKYSYETDGNGRIKRCEGTLRLEEGKRNTAHQTHAGGIDRRETDEGGHLIARRFGGSEKVDNLVPMEKVVNRKEYKELEDDWAKELDKGNTVDVKIRCKYEGDSQRPSEFVVKYKVTDQNGFSRTETKRIDNEKNGG